MATTINDGTAKWELAKLPNQNDLDSITVTASTQAKLSPSMSSNFSTSEQIVTFSVDSGIGAGTYKLNNLLQQLVNRSHSHTSKTISGSNCNCNCKCDCTCD